MYNVGSSGIWDVAFVSFTLSLWYMYVYKVFLKDSFLLISLTTTTNLKPACVGTIPGEDVPEEFTAHLHIQRRSWTSEFHHITVLSTV